MASVSALSFFTFLAILFGLLQVAIGTGQANLWHMCPYNVYCGAVVGCAPGTPPGACPGVTWTQLAFDKNITVNFNAHASGTGITIMCTRDYKASPILVTQLEWTWEQGQGLVYFDVSNVAGNPFSNEGFALNVVDAKDPGHKYNNCKPVSCAPGDIKCQQAYEVYNDDENAMRSCFDDAVLGLMLC